MASEDCPLQCAKWAIELFGYCLCTTNQAISLSLGIVSVISWGIAEIPQFITNYRTKSPDGLSLLFLVLWIIGDLFNMFGCLLETATLPTQLYMAVLYAVTTVTLTLQSIYYRHIYPRLKCNRQFYMVAKANQIEVAGEYNVDQISGAEKFINESCRNRPNSDVLQNDVTMSIPIPFAAIPRSHSAGQDFFYTSARSLSTSHTPTRSFATQRRELTAMDAKDPAQEPLLGRSLPSRPEHLPKTKNPLCIVPAMLFILWNLNISSTRYTKTSFGAFFSSRKLLQVNVQQTMVSSSGGGLGTFMGWAMAAIYMGGRLPQIRLNIKRGHTEGLNPFMFIFALLGNATYVASILVNSMEWSKILPNLPWLVDAVGCALLDTIILLQLIYFRRRQRSNLLANHGDAHPSLS